MAETREPLLPNCPNVHAARTEAATLRAQARAGLAAQAGRGGAVAKTEAPGLSGPAGFRARRHRADGFPGYFLIVADFIQWAKAQDIPVGPGRGSGAGSVVAWA